MGEHVFRTGMKFNSNGSDIVNVQSDIYGAGYYFPFDYIETSTGRSVSWQFLILYEDNSSKSGIVSATWTNDDGDGFAATAIIGDCETPDFHDNVIDVKITRYTNTAVFEGYAINTGGIYKMIRMVM